MANSELNKKKKKNSYKKTSNKTSKSRSKKKNTKKNYPYSRSKKTQNTKAQSAKKRTTKLDNNVSIKVDDKLEKLNYSILDENVNNDYKKNKVQSSRKIKTDFKDDIEVETLKDEKLEVVIEDIPNDVINFDDETPAEIEEKEEIVADDVDDQIEEELDSFITNNEDTEEISKLIDAIDIDEEVEELEDDILEDKDSESTDEVLEDKVIESIDENDQEKEDKTEEVEEDQTEEKEVSKSIVEIDEDEVNKLINEIDKADEEEEPELEIAELLDSEDISEEELEVLDTPSSEEELTDELDEVVEDITEENDKDNNDVIKIPLDLVKKYEESLEDVLEEEPIIKDNGEILSEELDEADTEDVDVLSIESDEDHSGVDESTSERIEAEDIHNVSMTENKDDILESTKIIEESFDDSKERAKEIYSHLEDEEVSSVNNEDKGYRRFILRLIILILILLLSIFFIINFSIKYINDSNVKDVNYYESSSIKYTLCTQGNCVEDTEIHGYNDSVSATFGYKSKFDEDISYNMNYSIVSLFEIVDPESKDVVFKDEENVLTKEIEAVKTDELKFSQDVDFSLTKFREDLSKYNEGKDKTYFGYVKLIMYTSGINDKKQVALLDIPLQDDLLKKKVVSYNTGDATVTISNKSDSGAIYVCLMIISLSIVIGSCIGLIVLLNTSSDDED